MTDKPCAIVDCPALALLGSSFCAVHDAMSAMLLRAEAEAAEQRRFKTPTLVPVTDRIEYEKKP